MRGRCFFLEPGNSRGKRARHERNIRLAGGRRAGSRTSEEHGDRFPAEKNGQASGLPGAAARPNMTNPGRSIATPGGTVLLFRRLQRSRTSEEHGDRFPAEKRSGIRLAGGRSAGSRTYVRLSGEIRADMLFLGSSGARLLRNDDFWVKLPQIFNRISIFRNQEKTPHEEPPRTEKGIYAD